MEGARVRRRVSGLEPQPRAPGSSQGLLSASTLPALIAHPGPWPPVCPQRHSPPPSEAGLAQAGLAVGLPSSPLPTLGPLPEWSRFLPLFWDSSPCLAASAALTPTSGGAAPPAGPGALPAVSGGAGSPSLLGKKKRLWLRSDLRVEPQPAYRTTAPQGLAEAPSVPSHWKSCCQPAQELASWQELGPEQS